MSEWFALRVLSAEAAMDWGIVGSTVVTGIVVVFLILAILVGFLSLIGYILGQKKKASAPVVAAPHAPAPVVRQEETDEEDDNELIAVISAAVAAYGEAEGKQYRVVGVKKRGDKAFRSGWSAAGIAENTRGLS